MPHDLLKLHKNYFQAQIENLNASNKIFIEFIRQLFSVTTFYLIFTATLFFFLESNLDHVVWGLTVSGWIGLSIISGTASLVLGIIALWGDKIFLLKSARYYQKKSNDVLNYIKQNSQTEIKSIPDELKVDKKEMTSSAIINYLVFFQTVLFIVLIVGTVIPIVTILVF